MGLSGNKKKVVLAGSVTTQSGYGSHARDIARALILSEKYDVSIIPIRWGNTPQDALNPEREGDRIILDRLVPGNLQYKPDVFIHVTIPNEFQPIGNLNIGITAGIETTACKPEWIEGCNRMDLVLATSTHSADVLKSMQYEQRNSQTGQVVNILKCTTDIEVLFEGIDTDVYNDRPDKTHRIYEYLSDIPESFCYLFVGHWLQGDVGHDRKDIGMLIKTFIDVFKRKSTKNRPALVLKTSLAGFSKMEYQQIHDRIQDIRNMCRSSGWEGDLPNIYVLQGNLTDSEMNTLYNHPKIKSMVSFTKGEGFGRPLLEFSMTGKPMIVSGWSGQLDFLDPEYYTLLPGKLEQVHPSAVNDWIIPESRWFTVNYTIAAQRMQAVMDKYPEYAKKSKKRKSYMRKTYSLSAMGDLLDKYIDSTTNVIKPQLKTIQLPKLKS